jgi:glycosidase
MPVLHESLRLRMHQRLVLLYGDDRAEGVLSRLEALIAEFDTRPAQAAPHNRVSEQDVLLITYGDLVQQAGQMPLATLHEALNALLQDVISGVHILPFFLYSSDDGFSVIDYLAVDPALGSWADVAALSRDYRLMFDAVINHISAESGWFQRFLAGEAPYTDYFIVVDPAADLSDVTRPRTSPLLTPFDTAAGEQHVWTTFSADQVDLNYASEDALLAVLQVLLTYVARGADLIRLDAIAYLWKEIGTSCIHLPQTHAVVQLMRDVLDAVAPDVLLITETNVPHEENISYFGDGTNEAQLVYQFPLPPLVLHSFRTGSAQALTDWAVSLDKVSDETTFFNFTASHDGIGVRPATGLISDADVQALTELTEARGGKVSYKANSDGSQSPYELNVTYVDAIINPDDDPMRQARAFLASQAIMLALAGVPGIYFHSLLGSRNWTAGVQQTGRARTVNREKLDYPRLRAELADDSALRHHIFTGYCDLLRIRRAHTAFHPNGDQAILRVADGVFALRRTAPDGSERILALHNVSGVSQRVTLDAAHVDGVPHSLVELISDTTYPWQADLTLTLAPYQVMWLRVEPA